MNYITIGIHYPRQEHKDDIINAIKKIAQPARNCKGLIDTGALVDDKNDRIILFSLWESGEAALEASKILRPMIAELPFSEWERQPSDNMVGLQRVI
ncbi:MAG: hypothetical protein AB1728_00920 [Bacteroidota bacterium]